MGMSIESVLRLDHMIHMAIKYRIYFSYITILLDVNQFLNNRFYFFWINYFAKQFWVRHAWENKIKQNSFSFLLSYLSLLARIKQNILVDLEIIPIKTKIKKYKSIIHSITPFTNRLNFNKKNKVLSNVISGFKTLLANLKI